MLSRWTPDFNRRVVLVLTVAVFYSAAAKLGLSLAFVATEVTPVWPASGIALAAAVLLGSRVWPGIWLGAFLINASLGEPLLAAAFVATGNTLEALTALWLLQRADSARPRLNRLKEAFGFVLAAGAAPLVAATVGVVSLCLGGVHPWSHSPLLWTTWWVGDTIGMLVIAPVVFTARTWKRWKPSRWRLAEASTLLAGATIVCFGVFGSGVISGRGLGSAYSVFPFVIWAAFRFGQPLTSILMVVIATLADWGTVNGLGPFAVEPLGSRLIPLQIFLGILVITGLILSAGIAERTRAERIQAAELTVTRAIAGSVSLKAASPRIVQAVCESLDWDLGSVWIASEKATSMECVGVWSRIGRSFPEFEALTRTMRFEPGRGLPGRVWQTGRSAFITDVAGDDNFPRADVAVREGIHGAFGFPIRLGDETIGVLEFFSRDARRADASVLAMFEKIGALMSQFMGRDRRDRERILLLSRESAARRDAERANRLKDEFLATLSHELRTPLNAILGWTHLLSEEALDKKGVQRAIETIRRNVRLQDQIISDILDVSRIIAGKIQLDLQDVSLDDALRMVLDSLRPTADAKHVALVHLNGHGAVSVRGDARRIEQMLWNLVSNAIKFVPENGRVDVSIRTSDAHTEISVQDDGPGIDPAFLPHIFERFRQADSSSTRSHGGLGLGLAIVRHLAEMHAGAVEARNRTDRSGAVFALRLPVARPQEASVPLGPSPPVAATEATRGRQEPRLDGVRVLVVDNDRDARELLAVILRRCGAEVSLAASASEALVHLGGVLPDVVLADIEMPGEDGYALLKRIRGLDPDRGGSVPVVAVTAYASESDRAKALAAGFTLHVAKPVQPLEIISIVDRIARAGNRRSQELEAARRAATPLPHETLGGGAP